MTEAAALPWPRGERTASPPPEEPRRPVDVEWVPYRAAGLEHVDVLVELFRRGVERSQSATPQ